MNAVSFSLRVVRAVPGNTKRGDPDNQWGKRGVLPDIVCDRCNKPVHWARVSSNGHVRAACETPDCFGLLS